MGTLLVDQVGPRGNLVKDRDTVLSEREKTELLLQALPGAIVTTFAGERVVRYKDQVILKKQVTHLGHPWPAFKKRIQIPRSWVGVERSARENGLVARFVGIYHYGEVTIFVDFDPDTYVLRSANNSAAHVATNDLYQAQTTGEFSREDRNRNRLTSVRSDRFSEYLLMGHRPDPRVDLFKKFNDAFLSGREVDAMTAVREMHASSWPDTFHGEWPGFYLEYKFDAFVRGTGVEGLVQFQKDKRFGRYDFDLVFASERGVDFYGDLKSSDVVKHEAPGNDAVDLQRCVSEFGRFWYVVYEHETHHARDHGDVVTLEWNNWKRSVGHRTAKPFDPLSYSRRFKQSVRYVSMLILEINEANFHLVLSQFSQGKQPDGASRAVKVMIKKSNIDNFLIYSTSVED